MQQSTMEGSRHDEPRAMEELARDPSSRKKFLRMVGGAGAASAFATFLAACSDDGGESSNRGASPAGGSPAEGSPADGAIDTREPSPDPRKGTSDLEILNYALKLEYIEVAFYGKVIDSDLFAGPELSMIRTFAANERQHRDTLEKTIQKLGGTPVEQPETEFPSGSRAATLRLAATLENAGAAAYLGQANRIKSKEVLAAALSIHSVEARHAAALNGLLGLPSAPEGSFAAPLTMEEVLTTVQGFISS